ncbi:hypothetical protein IE53DRAFT_387183 [Violaceomyces palustris]|uniref:Uncharacterized protein n=1 Tax=Violaceomyces palustris TaxID=1673888 RepID=A0ACD0NXD3_9BASI|nr:hypothetical protein IE53DRAFT_387183 [Violaceomyces palustris]
MTYAQDYSATTTEAHSPMRSPTSDTTHMSHIQSRGYPNPGSKEEDEVASSERGDPEKGRPAPLEFATYSFWSKELAEKRAFYLKGIFGFTTMICLLIWGIVSIYWGSLYKEIDQSPNIKGWIINRDSSSSGAGTIGEAVTQALLAANNGPKPHSTWQVVDPSLYPTSTDVNRAISYDEAVWVVVEVASDATARFLQARADGDASWDPTAVVQLVYATARNQNVVPSMIVAPATKTLSAALSRLGAQLAAQYLPTISNNATALQNLVRAPQTISSPLVLGNRDLVPYDSPVAIAPTFVGLIYLCILAFNVTMANMALRAGLQPYLRLKSLVAMRFLVPIVAYIFISLMFSLLNIPFDVTFGRRWSYGAGFMVWWSTSFVGMTVLGLATEAILSLVGPKFIGFGLLLWLIVNVSVANFPIELSPSFYKYGYSMPFYNLKQIYVSIIFDTGKPVLILKYMGILWAWLLVILITFPIWIWRERKEEQKLQRQKQEVVSKGEKI